MNMVEIECRSYSQRSKKFKLNMNYMSLTMTYLILYLRNEQTKYELTESPMVHEVLHKWTRNVLVFHE